MRSFIAIAVVVSLVLMPQVAFRGEATPNADSGVLVVASLSSLASIVSAIGGPYVNVSYILPDGMTPHEYRPTLADIELIQSADLIVLANSSFLTLEAEILENARSDALVLDYRNYSAEVHEIPNFGRNFHGYWLYPDNAMRIGRAVAEALKRLLPDRADYFEVSYSRFEARVKAVKDELMRAGGRAGLSGRKVLVSVPGVAYIAESFGAEVFATIFEAPGKTINSSLLGEAKKLAEEGGLRAVICPEELESSSIGSSSREVAEYLGVPLLLVRAFLVGPGYFEMMMYNAGSVQRPSTESQESYPAYILAIALLSAVSVIEAFIIFRKLKAEESHLGETHIVDLLASEQPATGGSDGAEDPREFEG